MTDDQRRPRTIVSGNVGRRALQALVLFVLLAAAVNLPLAVYGTKLQPAFATPPDLNLYGAEAAARGWPAPTATPWPDVTSFSQEIHERAVQRTAWSMNASLQTTHQMQAEFYGWPLPALRRVMSWSSSDHSPRFVKQPGTAAPGASGMSAGPGTGNEFNDSGLTLHWPGVLLNPVLFALPFWLVLVVPAATVLSIRRRLRVRRGLCPACAYPVGTSETCSECGSAVVVAS